MSNLIVLCSKCHNEVHYGNLIIDKYYDTSNGPILEWYYKNKKQDQKKKKSENKSKKKE